MSRAHAVVALVILCALLPACGDAPAEPTAESPPEVAAPLTRLWRDTSPERSMPVEGSAPPQLLFEARFDGSQAWWRGAFTPEGNVSFEAAAALEGELELTGGASIGRTHVLAVEPGSALRVRLRVRPTAPRALAAPIDLAALVERRDAFDPARTHGPKDVSALLDPSRSRVHVLHGELGDGLLECETRFVVDASTRELQVMLLAPVQYARRPFVVESLRVEQVSMAAHLAAGGGLPDLETLDDGVALSLDRDRREGLLLAPGATLTWDLPAHDSARRFEFAWGLPPWGAGSQGVQLRVTARAPVAELDVATRDSELLLDETLRAPDSAESPAWHDRQLLLPASPHGPLRLSVRADGLDAAAPVVMLAHPTVSLPPEQDAARPNVLLISLDTLRPDRLGSYGGDPRVSTHLDALAAEGHRFSQASSTSSYTLPSHASMLTGQYPAEHGAVDITDSIDAAHSPLLAAQLAAAGWTTAGFTAGGYVGTHYGFGAGFDRYSENDPVWPYDTLRGDMLLATDKSGREPIPKPLLRRYGADSIVDWLGTRVDGPPFFAFVHTYIAHNFAPSEAWLERFDLLTGPERRQRPFDHKHRSAFNKGEHALLAEVRDDYLPYYDATIGMADEFVGTLLAALEALELDEDTLVIVTSDHGEEFGEHGFFGHGETLNNANTRVPLIVRLPGPRAERSAQVIQDPVSLADLAPWILELCGLPVDPRMSLATERWRTSSAPPRRDGLFIELDTFQLRTSAVREGELKLHVELEYDREAFEPERVRLYDVHSDPEETHDLAAERPDDVQRLRERLTWFHEFTNLVLPRDGGGDPCSVPRAERERMQALGYLAGVDCGDQ
ncbi:MAG: hypothetical protein DHS20C15_24900 [Planctomycetota bacterium]|nr:MAG: hypothetical protein DHS20C15_24900 [Planctomycetota bacterium]